MYRKGVMVGAVVASLLPVMAHAVTVADLQAQLDALLAQIAAISTIGQVSPISNPASVQTPLSGACPAFSRVLQRGSEGADVTDLQKYLQALGLLSAEPTGYFGPLTEQALKAFQSREGIVSSGSPATTGWGLLGPRTRSHIAAICAPTPTGPVAVQTPATAPAQCPAQIPAPAGTCATNWVKLQDVAGCHIGWGCSPKAANTPEQLAVVRVDGPTTLSVNELGRWHIDATGEGLTYGVSWGDENVDSLLNLLAGYGGINFVATSTFTHAYIRSGTYKPEITVRDKAGNTAVASLQITVSLNVATTTAAQFYGVDTPTGPAGPGSCMFFGAAYPAGTVTEGYTIDDLCLATGGVCQQRSAYVPKFKCANGLWENQLTNPYPNLPAYSTIAGSICSNNGEQKTVVVEPGSQLCRGLLCAIAKNYAPITMRCQYTSWVDWGAFSAGATTTSVCAEPTPCEYTFGQGGRACAAKQNGICQAAPYQNHPTN